MTAEQLPDGLQQTGINSPFNACMYRDDCRSEHTQRLTLQHHAADQVWRIADLEVKCVTLKELHDAATDERDALRVKVSDLERATVKRREISDGVEAELVDECDTLRTLKSREEAERNELIDQRDRGDAQNDLLLAELRQVNTERDALRARLAAPQAWLAEYAKDWHAQGSHYAYAEATDPDAPDEWTTEDVVKAFVAGAELAERDASAKLAEIEAQEPVALVETSGNQGAGIGWSGAAQPVGAKLYARPVTAQAVLDVDALAQYIRSIDGRNSLGAGALAERIVEWLEAPEHKA